jgi:C-terminal processing protease CtpA/Prc
MRLPLNVEYARFAFSKARSGEGHMLSINRVVVKAVFLVAALVALAMPAWPQKLSSVDREKVQAILGDVTDDVRKYYYDPKLHGLDWDAKVQQAKEHISKVDSWNTGILEVAAVLEALNDSHTFFAPPADPMTQEYGWRYQVMGSHCYVTHVRPKSDAENKGMSPGDEVLTIDGFTPDRSGLDKMEYVLNTLVPQSSLRVDLRDRTGKVRRVDVVARKRQTRAFTDIGDETGREQWGLRLEYEDERRLVRPQAKDLGKGLMILRLPEFTGEDIDAKDMIGKARKCDALIIDLRGDPGGAENTLKDLLVSVFEKDVKIADRVMRDSKEPVVAKGNHHNFFAGKLIVLVDSRSASASELFARVVQIEKRGTILGDRSSGSVMEARHYFHQTGSNPKYFFGSSVSSADLIMTDGKSLEHVGVTPDETIVPTAADLANNRDPVLARAAEIVGIHLSPEDAARLFPYEWPRK